MRSLSRPLRRSAVLALFAVTLLPVLPGRVSAQDAPGPTDSSVAAPDETVPTEGAPEVAPPPPAVDPSPHVRVLIGQLGVMDAEDRLAREQQALADSQVRADGALVDLQTADEAVRAAGAAVDRARDVVGDLAVESFIYASGGRTTATEGLTVFRQRTEHQLTSTVVERKLDALDAARQALAAAEATRAQRQAALDAADADLDGHRSSVQAATDWLAGTRRELATARAQDGPVLYDPAATDRWQLTIAGESVLTADELAAWFASVGTASRAQAPVADLATWFVDEGRTEGIRGDMAFAQAVLETGMFTNDDTVRFNNYAGIGHCDSCGTGWAFATPQDGVRAQIQLLKSYVYAQPEYQNPLVDRRLHGPAGCCQTWNALGGVWASASNYGPSLHAVYQAMLEFALTRRTAFPLTRPV